MNPLLLNKLIIGYDELEPVILGLMAMDKSFLLIGRHGTGKTKVAKWLSRGYGDGSFVFYDATKDDLISIAGIPDPESLKTGKLRFAGHERSIWNKSVIVVDEITRAAKENQNLWLEILEERTCFGLPLKYRSIIATANPESYAAAFQLDEALLDRFYAVVPVPEMQVGIASADVKSMVELSLRDGSVVSHKEIIKVFDEIRKAHASLISEGASEKIGFYLAEIVPPVLKMFQEQNGLYMSPRTYCHILPESILSISAYFRAAGHPEPLQEGALYALRYSVATKLQTNALALEQYHNAAVVLLKNGTISDTERIKIDLNSENDPAKQIAYLEQNWTSIIAVLSDDELEKALRGIFKYITDANDYVNLLRLQSILVACGYQGDTLRQLKGKLNTSLFNSRRKLLPVLKKAIQNFTEGNGISNAQYEKLVLADKLISDNNFIFGLSEELTELKSAILTIADKYEKPGIDEFLREIGQVELHSM